MNRRIGDVRIVIVTLAVLAAPGGAIACACCSNDGQRLVQASQIDAFAGAILDEVRFASHATLSSGELDIDSIAGITAGGSDFSLSVTKSDERWTFEFSGNGGGGQLLFPLPAALTRFEVDPREPGSAGSPLGPLLYKEWRLFSRIASSGIFEGGEDEQDALLILHGRGNGCTDASQFDAWTLVVSGIDWEITFFGDLIQ